ncbi:MAG: ABC transporter permease [Blautia obeum]|nr:ABC transporter permease [Blautia obeum]
MAKYILKRCVSIIVTLFLVCTITFIMMKAVPGGPFTTERNLPQNVLEALERKYHLDDPVWKQYVDYVKGAVVFDFGPSFKKDGVMVSDMIAQSFPVSAKLGLVALAIVIILGIPCGIIAALKQNKIPDYLAMIFATLGIAIPTFVLGTVILYVFGSKLGWIPTHGLSSWKGYIGPSISLAGFSLAYVLRLTRSSMLGECGQDYVRTARAKGLPERKVIFKHALKNALIPVVTYIGPMTAGIMTGSFVTEKIYAIPGMGKFYVEAINNRDYTVIMGTTMFYAAIAAIMILAVDIAYAFLDPRIKFQD